MQTTERDVSYDRFLTDRAIGYKNKTYIIDDLVQTVNSSKESGIIPKFNQSPWFRNQAALRAPGTEARRIGFSTDNSATYFVKDHSVAFPIPDEIRRQQDAPYDMDSQGAEFIADKLLMDRELDFSTNYFTTSVWGTDKTGSTDFTQWSDYANSSPLSDISNFADTTEGLIAAEPNILAMGKQVWVKLKWHPDVIDTIKYTQRGQMSVELFSQLVEMNKVLVGRGIYTSSPEGTAEGSVSYSRIWGKHALMIYQPETPTIMAPAACYNFTWNVVPNSKMYVRTYREDSKLQDVLEGHTYYDMKVTAANAGLFMSSAVA